MTEEILKILKESWKEIQQRPDQYVVVIKHKKDDNIIGYHLSTMCQVTKDILQAKRYSGLNPYKQIEVIANNIKNCIFKEEKEGIFSELFKSIKKEFYKDINVEDIYLDAIYLNPNIEPQNFRYQIIDNIDETNNI